MNAFLRAAPAAFAGIVCAVLLSLSPALPDQLDDALAAYEREDYAEALRLWRPLAEEGDPVAQFWMGHLYRTGLGAEEDIKEAIRWYRLSAEQQHPWAEYMLATLYYVGIGLPKDLDEAVRWLRRAAEHGDLQALNELRKLFVSGEWTPTDDASTREWYRAALESLRAREDGLDPDELYFIGVLYERGGLMPAEPVEAAYWFKKAHDRYLPAAEAGDRHAQCMLYYIYSYGQGVFRSEKEAERWLGLAEQQQKFMPCLQESFTIQ